MFYDFHGRTPDPLQEYKFSCHKFSTLVLSLNKYVIQFFNSSNFIKEYKKKYQVGKKDSGIKQGQTQSYKNI